MVDRLSQQFEGQDTNWGLSSLTATRHTIRPNRSRRLRRRRYRRDVRETFFCVDADEKLRRHRRNE
jgi:hypothetical protein